jgi:phenylpyruvate tautomerase
MPCIELTTNVRIPDKSKLMRLFSDCVCTGMGKAETYMMVMVRDGESMFFGGNDEPVAHMTLRALGLKEELIRKLAGELTRLVQAELGIESQRVYIVFMDADPGKWAWDGRTFA